MKGFRPTVNMDDDTFNDHEYGTVFKLQSPLKQGVNTLTLRLMKMTLLTK